MNLPFTWDERKAEANMLKHGVTSGEAATVFIDPLAAIFSDEQHSLGDAGVDYWTLDTKSPDHCIVCGAR
jgi:uncharacterized DUF497 family protein